MSRREVYAALAKWHHPHSRDEQPFGDLGNALAADRSSVILGRASALLMAVSAAFRDRQALLDRDVGSEVDALSSDMVSAALDGITTLVDFGTFLLENPK